jgi:hypothetical protein
VYRPVIVASLTRTAAVWVVVRKVVWRSKRMRRSKIVSTLSLQAGYNEALVLCLLLMCCRLIGSMPI